MAKPDKELRFQYAACYIEEMLHVRKIKEERRSYILSHPCQECMSGDEMERCMDPTCTDCAPVLHMGDNIRKAAAVQGHWLKLYKQVR